MMNCLNVFQKHLHSNSKNKIHLNHENNSNHFSHHDSLLLACVSPNQYPLLVFVNSFGKIETLVHVTEPYLQGTIFDFSRSGAMNNEFYHDSFNDEI